MVCGYTTPQSLITQIQSGLSVSQGAFEYNLMGSWPFSKISTTCLGKIFISIPCFRIIGLQKNLKTPAFCSWTNSHNLLWNFWSNSLPGLGIYAGKWYPDKWHILQRFIWMCPLFLSLNSHIFSIYRSFKSR